MSRLSVIISTGQYDQPISINYRFYLKGETEGADRSILNIPILINAQTLERIHAPREEWPHWVELDFNQCPHCPVDLEKMPLCPLATNLIDLLEASRDLVSHESVTVEVTTAERTVTTSTTLQRAIASVMGLLMATSGCPYTRFFKPMARFHLPFSSEAETLYRASSMYLLADYFRTRGGNTPDRNLDGLLQIYRDIQKVNIAMASRIRAAIQKDASLNAVVLLDMLAKALPFEIEESLEELRELFRSYLE